MREKVKRTVCDVFWEEVSKCATKQEASTPRPRLRTHGRVACVERCLAKRLADAALCVRACVVRACKSVPGLTDLLAGACAGQSGDRHAQVLPHQHLPLRPILPLYRAARDTAARGTPPLPPLLLLLHVCSTACCVWALRAPLRAACSAARGPACSATGVLLADRSCTALARCLRRSTAWWTFCCSTSRAWTTMSSRNTSPLSTRHAVARALHDTLSYAAVHVRKCATRLVAAFLPSCARVAIGSVAHEAGCSVCRFWTK
jgi:hypothetical protein